MDNSYAHTETHTNGHTHTACVHACTEIHTGNCAHLVKHHLVRRPFLLLTLLLQHGYICVRVCVEERPPLPFA